ncbi:hypothetical protein EDB84DRAFT_166930 [Lactarius hengduanensis]|nr:hypothetical protein EDB84DRAFT_166930 [Lactarius hengduanensis]
MPFGGRFAYFAWPLGLLCLHLARLLPGDFSQPSPTAFARAPERPGRPSLPAVTALGHRSSLAVARDCHARLPPLFSSPPPTPPCTGLLGASLGLTYSDRCTLLSSPSFRRHRRLPRSLATPLLVAAVDAATHRPA